VRFSATERTCNILEMGLELNQSQMNQTKCYIFKALHRTRTGMQKKWQDLHLKQTLKSSNPNQTWTLCTAVVILKTWC